MNKRPRFHLAFPVTNLAETKHFYSTVLGCQVGRTAERWADFSLFGHQISAHLVDAMDSLSTNSVDGDAVPVRHFGLILEPPDWQALRERIEAAEVPYLIAPKTRDEAILEGQLTFFINDPSGNALEFKSFTDESLIFKA